MCIKANELDLALDVFSQLLHEGCVPNLVTYNILIDVRLLPPQLSAQRNELIFKVQVLLHVRP